MWPDVPELEAAVERNREAKRKMAKAEAREIATAEPRQVPEHLVLRPQ
jgi:hypothetical protein